VKQRIVFALLLLALVLVAFQETRGFAFLSWDDTINVTENPLVVGAESAGLSRAWSEPYAGLYVPVAYTWFWCCAKLSGAGVLDPRVFHVGNLLLHFAAAWFVFRILAQLVANERAALVGALVFAVHPLVVESVAWVTEARGLLSALLCFIALDLWLARAIAERDGRAVGATWRAVVATLCFSAALLSKPQAAALPLTLLVLDRFMVGRPWKRVLPIVFAWSALAFVVFLVTKSLQTDATLRSLAPISSRPLVALDTFGFYAWKTVLPLDLAADYGRTPGWLLESSTRAVLAFGFAALLAVLVAVRPLRRWLPFAALFVSALLPVSGLVPFGYQDISTVADRYAYPALFAVALPLADHVA
jgi:hypothetical protein